MVLLRAALITCSLAGGAASAHAQVASHVDLHRVKELLAHSEHSDVAIVIFGDSRSTWGPSRVPGAIARNWDVKWAGLAFGASTANVGTEDGLGQMMYALQNVTTTVAAPGEVTPGSGILNRYPGPISEQAVAPGTDEQLWVGIHASVACTAGHSMYTSQSGAPGGNYYRGDPAQGRAISSIEYAAITTSTAPTLGLVFGLNYNGNLAWPYVFSQEFPAPVGASADPEIIVRTTPGNGSTGTNIRLVMGHRMSEWHQYAGRVHNWIGTRINYAGGAGCVLGVVAQGGWSITDHLGNSVHAPNDNPDGKYGAAELTEWYAKCLRSPRALLRWEVGANISTGFAFEHDAAEVKESTRIAVTRARNALIAGGATEVVVELVSYWGSAGDAGGPESRSSIWRQTLHDLAAEQGWSFYDQLGALIDGGHTAGNALRNEFRIDAAHQNFAGMNLLGQLEWSAISAAAPPCGSSDFDGDGDAGTDADIEAFFSCLAGQCCAACFGPDFNGDGDSGTDADIEAFFRVLAGSAC